LERRRGLRARLYQELAARLVPDEASVPWQEHGRWYQYRYPPGAEHPVWLRREGAADGPEQELLDANERAAGHAFHEIGGVVPSPDGRWLAFTEGTVGHGEWQLCLKDLTSGEVLAPA